MIKICYIIGQLSRGGAERQLYELVKGINRDKFYPLVISLSQGGDWVEAISKLNIRVIEIQRRKNKEFTRLFKLVKLLKEIKPDIVHTYLFSANSYGRIAAILSRVPVLIASERSLPEVGKDKSKFNMYIDKLLGLFSHGIICNSLKASKVLVKKYSYDIKKVFTVYNGVDIAAFTGISSNNGQNNKISKKVVGTIGRLDPVKNHKLFLDAAKIVLDISADPDIKFLIVGKGPLQGELEKYAEKLGIENSVVFTGERTGIPDLLQGMDIFVMTSLYEGLSNAIIEAMSAGITVVAPDVGGNSELIVEGETGFLCQSFCATAFAEKVLHILNNEKEAKQMGENGKKRIMNEFGIEKMIIATENIYQKLLKKEGVLSSHNMSRNFTGSLRSY